MLAGVESQSLPSRQCHRSHEDAPRARKRPAIAKIRFVNQQSPNAIGPFRRANTMAQFRLREGSFDLVISDWVSAGNRKHDLRRGRVGSRQRRHVSATQSEQWSGRSGVTLTCRWLDIVSRIELRQQHDGRPAAIAIGDAKRIHVEEWAATQNPVAIVAPAPTDRRPD